MKSTDIDRAIRDDPKTEFALKPDPKAQDIVLVRGLRRVSGMPGSWTYDEIQYQGTDEWVPVDAFTTGLDSRRITTPAEARRTITARDSYATKRDLKDRLINFGILSTISAGELVIRDCRALDRLLDEVHWRRKLP